MRAGESEGLRAVRLRVLLLCLAAQLALGAVDEAASLSAARKFQQIAEKSLPSGARVEFSEDELNALLRIPGAISLPQGSKDPEVSLRKGGAALRMQVDLDAAREAQERLPVLMRLLLRGTREILVDFDLAVKGGRASLKLVSVLVEGVEIPEPVVAWFVEAYAPPEIRPYLEGEGADAGIGLSRLDLEPGLAIGVVE